jgi:hypothetical protein
MKEGSGRSKKVTSTMMTCLKRQINKKLFMIAAEIKIPFPELSSISKWHMQCHLHTPFHLLSKWIKDLIAKQSLYGH